MFTVGSIADRTISPLIIATLGNTSYLAHLLDTKFVAVFMDKCIDYLYFLAKMPIAFFKIATSSSKS
uniref:hypothetical protein n=1 Tax=Oceanobacillus oncorhynchi TaxID=545501 RepID=UPI001BB36032